MMKAHKIFVNTTALIRFPETEYPLSKIVKHAVSGIGDEADRDLFFPTSTLNTTFDIQLKQDSGAHKPQQWQVMLGLPAGLALSFLRDESFECYLAECATEFIIYALHQVAEGNTTQAVNEWYQIWHELPVPADVHRQHEEIYKHGFSSGALNWHGWEAWAAAAETLVKRANALEIVGL